jgi:hypothetical protein
MRFASNSSNKALVLAGYSVVAWMMLAQSSTRAARAFLGGVSRRRGGRSCAARPHYSQQQQQRAAATTASSLPFHLATVTATPTTTNTCSSSSRRPSGLLWLQTTTRGGATAGGASTSTALNSVVVGGTDEGVLTESKPSPPVALLRKDYQPLPFTVQTIQMNIHLAEGKTTVTTDLTVQRNPKFVETSTSSSSTLVLDGDQDVKLVRLQRNGVVDPTTRADACGSSSSQQHQLILQDVHDGDVIQIVTEIVPEDNTQLSGLYKR